MQVKSPFVDDGAVNAEEAAQVRRAQDGDSDALESLVQRHSPWIYNISLRMLAHPDDAEDASQEILIKAVTRLSTFEGRSSFRTWLYRIAVNHLLNMQRLRRERWSFEAYAKALDELPESDLGESSAPAADVQLWLEEAKIGCTTGLLLCLDREQRLLYILGDIFGVSDRLGAELLEITRDGFRQKLARARRDLQNFAQGKCGLMNPANPCRCARKTRGFIAAGYVNPTRLLFVGKHQQLVRDVAPAVYGEIEAADREYAEFHRAHPFQTPPDLLTKLRALLGLILLSLFVGACNQVAPVPEQDILAMERAAADRWRNGDPDGYLELMAPDVTYFDPVSGKRVDGYPAVKALIEPVRGRLHYDSLEIIAPLVQRAGDAAVLTYALRTHGVQFDNGPKSEGAWNTTNVYRVIDGKWRLVHSHFARRE